MATEVSKQKASEILFASGKDDCEVFSSASVSDDFDDFMFSEEEDKEEEISLSYFSSNSADGPLYELSSLMVDLPIKKGLSKFFQGKSQSFTSLSQVRCIEDLAKKDCPYNNRMKLNRQNEKSYMNHKSYFGSNPCSRIISKIAPKNSSGSVLARNKSSRLF